MKFNIFQMAAVGGLAAHFPFPFLNENTLRIRNILGNFNKHLQTQELILREPLLGYL